ncbi:response regulator [Bariatricus massiliensis]|uniref:Stage 0 sporulation protein A homolog n=1 Tax=Bariatricus massiliensis TaxID=1745713 RepID=A0ABS8DGL5_9FIRM|nr:response regulator [Bariatricus massiliensis]MCB7304448.1 response regulator [Bariatricus massiliensis]MCB7375099.1 response regulator [Bariatricus massiliensis]MCB7387558.1 response regulator [Bariatricus massiliensis]MCB7411720.1 response regulator [Bariatricus massiliensis]MCQ5253855.1 response regulator [Bariatricus massiliensis]
MECDFPNIRTENLELISMLQVSASKNLLDDHFTLVCASEFYYDLIGYTKEEYERLYQNQWDLYYAADKPEWHKLQKTIADAFSAHQPGYKLLSRMRRKNGAFIWVKLTGTFSGESDNGYPLVYTTVTDVSDIMLDRSEHSADYDDIPGLVARYLVPKDLDLKILGANNQFLQFFGDDIMEPGNTLYRRDLEKNLDVLVAHRDELLRGEPVSLVARMYGQHGEDVWFQTSMACVGWQGEDPIYLTIFIDITNETELREMQKKLEKQAEELKVSLELTEQASRAKTDFFSNMSHDIRTPMNAIIGMANIARSHLGDDEKVDNCLKKLLLSSQHLLGLINDVLDMSRIENGKMTVNPESLSLPELLENVVAIMQPTIKAAEQQFSIHLKGIQHEWFCADALRMRQIFINILSNASKFTPAKGCITVDVEELNSADADTAVMRFSFSDTGIGMTEDFIAHLFDTFSRERNSQVAKTEGSGLGMAITKRLTELMGGTIEVHSQSGKGSCFQVTLPLLTVKAPDDGVFPNLKIMVVDDDHMIGEYLKSAFEKLGVCIENAGSSMEAVAMLEKSYQEEQIYDAILLDWKMPEMNGPQTVREIRSRFDSNIPILIVSAYDWGDIEDEAKASGVDGFISKPLFRSTVCHALKKYVLGEKTESFHQEQTLKFAGQRFLLVEDNALNREIVIDLLTEEGAKIEYAINGADGVTMFKQSPEHFYNLILMDVQMPVMDGYEATKRIRALERDDAKNIPILAMTADAFAEDVDKAQKSGMNGHLAKPLEIQTMYQKISDALQS